MNKLGYSFSSLRDFLFCSKSHNTIVSSTVMILFSVSLSYNSNNNNNYTMLLLQICNILNTQHKHNIWVQCICIPGCTKTKASKTITLYIIVVQLLNKEDGCREDQLSRANIICYYRLWINKLIALYSICKRNTICY